LADFVEGFLSNYSENVQAISRKLRDIVRHEMKGADEFLYYNAINYSLSDSSLDRICYIRPLTTKVTFGFLYGKNLEDPDHILRGIGKRSRYVRITSVEAAKNAELKQLVKEAWKDAGESVRAMKEDLRRRRADLRRISSHRRTRPVSCPHTLRHH